MYCLKRYTTLPTKYLISLASRTASLTRLALLGVTPLYALTLYIVHESNGMNQLFKFILILVLQIPENNLTTCN